MSPETGSNPFTAEEMIVLNDGVPRRFRFDLNAQILLGDVYQRVGQQNWDASRKNGLAMLRLNLWAGMASDVHQRLHDTGWTIFRVGELMDGVDLEKLIGDVSRLVAAANRGPGEAKHGKPSKKNTTHPRPRNGRR